jgi:hypothetical protein
MPVVWCTGRYGAPQGLVLPVDGCCEGKGTDVDRRGGQECTELKPILDHGSIPSPWGYLPAAFVPTHGHLCGRPR